MHRTAICRITIIKKTTQTTTCMVHDHQESLKYQSKSRKRPGRKAPVFMRVREDLVSDSFILKINHDGRHDLSV